MSNPATSMALKTSVGMMDAAEDMHTDLEKGMRHALLSETVVYEQEFKYPRMKKVESWFWILFYTGSAGIFMLIFMLALLAFYIYLKQGADIGPALNMIWITLFLSMVIMFISACYTVPKGTKQEEREWMKVVLTKKFLILLKTNIQGLQLKDIYNKKRERGRFVLTIMIKKIVTLKPHILNWVVKRFRNRDEILMLKLVRRGEVINIEWTENLFFPIPALTPFLTVLRRLGPHIKLHEKLEAVQ
jgi:hypothetical protein